MISKVKVFLVATLAWASFLVFGCNSTGNENTPVERNVEFSNNWLEKHIEIDVKNAGINADSGLYELDAQLKTEELQKQVDSYRIVVRTKYYQGSPPTENIIDTSAWSDLILQIGEPLEYHSTSLQPADGHIIEIAYPKEVGLR